MGQEELCRLLDRLGIAYRLVEHEAVRTIEDMEKIGLPDMQCVAKNLFLRNANGKRHYLVTMPHDKPLDLKELRGKLGEKNLSFASEDRLVKHLGVQPGSVTPLGVLNGLDPAVTVVLDEDLKQREQVAVHPNVNTATLYLLWEDLITVLEQAENPVTSIKL